MRLVQKSQKYLDLCHSQPERPGHELLGDNQDMKPFCKSITCSQKFRVSREPFVQDVSQNDVKSNGSMTKNAHRYKTAASEGKHILSSKE